MDRGMVDDKLICCHVPVTDIERERVLRFFRFYAKCKALLNLWRGRSGRNACEGWRSAGEALARARPRDIALKGAELKGAELTAVEVAAAAETSAAFRPTVRPTGSRTRCHRSS